MLTFRFGIRKKKRENAGGDFELKNYYLLICMKYEYNRKNLLSELGVNQRGKDYQNF